MIKIMHPDYYTCRCHALNAALRVCFGDQSDISKILDSATRLMRGNYDRLHWAVFETYFGVPIETPHRTYDYGIRIGHTNERTKSGAVYRRILKRLMKNRK